jgi:hypothetical protein
MIQGLRCLRVSAEARLQSQVSVCEVCGVKVGIGTGFLPSHFFPPVSIIPPTLQTELYLQVAVTRKEKLEKPRKIPQKFPIAEMGDHCEEFPFTVWAPKTTAIKLYRNVCKY